MNNPVPEHFEVFIGVFCGPSFRVKKLYDGKLEYQSMGRGFKIERMQFISPRRGQWEKFWSIMEKIDAWGWKREYENITGAHDGTLWNVAIEFKEKKLESSGVNNFPGEFAEVWHEDPKEETETAFNLFIMAVDELIGGLKFS